MPVTNKKNAEQNMGIGGSDIGIQVLLRTDEATKIYGSSATEGWYTFATLEGGTVAYQSDSTHDKDEAGNKTGRVIESDQQYVLQNTIKETGDATLKLLDELVVRPHRLRYALPFPEKEFDVDGMDTLETHPAHQLHGFYRAQLTPGWDFPTSDGEKRVVDIEFVITKSEDDPGHVFKTVWLSDDTTWEYVDGDDLSDFQDDATYTTTP